MKITRFISIEDNNPAFLAKLIDNHIQAGWQPRGEIIKAVDYIHRDRERYVQIMVAYEQPKKRKRA